MSEKNYTLAVAEIYKAIDNATPNPEWIVELPSKTNRNEKYRTIKLSKMEELMKMHFGYAAISEISEPVITCDKNSRFAVTVRAVYEFQAPEGGIRKLYGIATSVVNDITMLELATPKASSMAVKNAIKQLGGLFGKYLNDSDDAEQDLPSDEKKFSIEEQRAAIIDGIVSSKSLMDLKSWRNLVYSKMCTHEEQALYETKLRQLSDKATLINSK